MEKYLKKVSLFESYMDLSLERLLQPGEEGLVIATNNEYTCSEATKIYLWDYGHPRKFFEGPLLKNLVYHNGSLIANQNEETGWKVRDIIRDITIAPRLYGHLSSDGKDIYGTQDSEQWIDVNEDNFFYSYKPFQIGPIRDGNLEAQIERHWFVTSLAVQGEKYIVGERKFPARRQLDWQPRCTVLNRNGTEKHYNLYDNIPYCLLPTPKDIMVGVEFGIYNITTAKSVHHFRQAHQYRQELIDLYNFKLTREDRKHIQDIRVWMQSQKVTYQPEGNNRIDTEVRWALEEAFTIRHMALFEGRLVYATNHKLFMQDREEPIHYFKDRISNLVTVGPDLLKEIRGKTSVRGAKTHRASLITLRSQLSHVA